jgi:hypothetical protein
MSLPPVMTVLPVKVLGTEVPRMMLRVPSPVLVIPPEPVIWLKMTMFAGSRT